MAYVRTVKTSSGATAVQIVHSSRRGSRNIEHPGSAHDEVEMAALKAAAAARLAAGQHELALGLDLEPAGTAERPLEIVASRMGHLWEALCRAYDALGFDAAAGGDEVFRGLVLARIIEPSSKQDSLRVLAEVGVQSASYPTLNRRLPVYAKDSWRDSLAAACAAHAALGPASLGTAASNLTLIDVRTVAGRLGHGGGGTTTLKVYSAWRSEADQRARNLSTCLRHIRLLITESPPGCRGVR